MKILICILLLFALSAYKSQTTDWVSLPQEISGSSNAKVNDLVVYNGKLIACGDFTAVGSATVNNIAAWDGTQWTGLGNGLIGNYASKMVVLNNELYVAGIFHTAGTVAAMGVTKWNGTTWTSLATSVSNVNTIASFNNEIYVGGNFGTIDGVTANYIAKYNGTNWQALGGSIAGANVNFIYGFNNALYVSGSFNFAGGSPADNFAKWDGTNWQGLHPGNCGGFAMIEWNGKLLLPNCWNSITSTGEIKQWDNNNWSLFSQPITGNIGEFYIFNNKLYSTWGFNIPSATNDSWVYQWDQGSQTWSKVGTGINYAVFGFCEYNGELYCAGYFNKTKDAKHNYIAKLATVTALNKNKFEYATVKFFPNPVAEKLNIEFTGNKTGDLNITVSNALRQTVLSGKTQILNSKCDVDMAFLKSGVYYLKIQNEEGSKVFKIVKE